MTELVVTDIAGGVATIRLNRPDARNALDMALKAALAEAIETVAHDPAIRCVVLTGTGESFCAGGDIKEMALNTDPVTSRRRLQKLLAEVAIPLATMEKPTVAAVNGHAHGAGFSLALACDIIVAAEEAKFSCAFAKVGLLPDMGSLYFLPRRVPMGIAKELVFTGRWVTAAEAVELGIANRAVPQTELASTVAELAGSIAESATIALGLSKQILDRSLQSSLDEVAALEAYGQAVLYTTNDHAAARQSFIDKQKPTFTGS